MLFFQQTVLLGLLADKSPHIAVFKPENPLLLPFPAGLEEAW
ncbi:hypothetical protein [Thermoflexibacter ruber]|nr:hypothetical protein [Thermoflexibacter ruber]